MNFIEIFRKYDKVVESFVGKTKSKTVKGIIDDADRYVSKDKEILRQLKEFVKQDGYEEDFGFKEDLPGQFYIEHQNDEGEFEEWVIIELNLVKYRFKVTTDFLKVVSASFFHFNLHTAVLRVNVAEV